MKSREMAQFENQVQSELARQNRVPGDWRKTVIAETPGAVASDPLRGNFYGGDYNDVRIFPISDSAQKRSRGVIHSLERIARRLPASRKRRRQNVAFDREAGSLFREYLPHARERVADALRRLARDLGNRQRTSATWDQWTKLQRYFRRFPEGSRVRDLDPAVVDPALKELDENLIDN